jgi:23S rRNA pseudouridine1911/1915/1917 synthase
MTIKNRQPMPMEAFFAIHFSGKSRSDLKSMLSHRLVYVNDEPVVRIDRQLQAGDVVTVRTGKVEPAFRHPKVRVVFEDDYLLVADKVEGLLAVATDGGKDDITAFSILADYLRQKNQRLFIVHRIDRDTSGLLMFAKSREMQATLQENWHETVTERVYIAVVEGVPDKDEDQIVSNLNENKAFKIYSTGNGKGQKAITSYRMIRKNDRYAMLSVELDTGRKNQIRVHMQDIGHPIIGDRKYGASASPIGRMGLHAQALAFVHPATKETLRFETHVPRKFNALFTKND